MIETLHVSFISSNLCFLLLQVWLTQIIVNMQNAMQDHLINIVREEFYMY